MHALEKSAGEMLEKNRMDRKELPDWETPSLGPDSVAANIEMPMA
jgi:hypothetical protein